MLMETHTGPLQVRLAGGPADLGACQALRHLCFFGRPGLDADQFDGDWDHLMVIDGRGAVLATLRYRVWHGDAAQEGYAAQFYDLGGLAADMRPQLEIGRFCVHPACPDPHLLRMIWGRLTAIVDADGIGRVFGCTSFPGLDPAPHAASFRRLFDRHRGPAVAGSLRRSAEALPLADVAGDAPGQPMPPLLRTYLAMGGWVSDHAVPDRQMNTLHVLTVLDVDRVPPARARALRALV